MEKRGKIFLVNTNFMKPLVAPIGLDYVAEALDAAGFEPWLVDLAIAEDPDTLLKSALRMENPLLVGVTVRNIDDCYMSSGECFLPAIRKWIKKIKSLTDSPVVVGGVGYSIDPVGVLDEVGADYGIRGDGEAALVELAVKLCSGEEICETAGLVYRSKGRGIENPPRPADLARFTPRRRNFVDNPTYFNLGGQGAVETKRGCDRKCIYCADPVAKGRTLRLAPPVAVADEIEALLEQEVDVLHLCDSEFNLPPNHAMEVCEELARRKLGGRARWYAYLSPQPFSRQLAGAMRAAGCAGINFGTDSTHPKILQNLGRKYTETDISRAVSECRRAGIPVMLDLLLGGPGETPETVKRTVEAVKSINPDRVGISLGVRVFPGTPLAEWIKRKRIPLRRPALHPDDDLLHPAFYVSPSLGPRPESLVADLVGNDTRFFFADPYATPQNYNYNDNKILVDAVARGCRGAYWDILRRLADEHGG